MEKDHKVALKKNRLLLATDLIGDEVFQYLVEKKILNDFMVESIESKSTVFKKNIEFLTLLPKRGPKAFHCFVDALDASDQSHLKQKLISTLKKDTGWVATNSTVNNASTLPEMCEHSNLVNLSAAASNFSFASSYKTYHTGNAVKKRVATENDEIISNIQSFGHSPQKKLCFKTPNQNHSETIPSPCGPLDDILSTTPLESLISSSNVKENTKVPSYLKSQSNCDLADGPTLDDLMVRAGRQIQDCHFFDCYKMKSSSRGLALIISIDHFERSTGLDNRQAGEVDRARLEFVLRQLGFKCYLLVDGTAQEIWSILEQFVALDDHYNMDVSMLVAMSHGEEGCFFGRDGKPVYTDKIIDLFNNASCKGLRDKPKVLLFQSCRGSLPDQGVIDISDGRHPHSFVTAPEADLSSSRFSLDSVNDKLPTHSDCLVGYATVKGFAAMRNTKYGSWYIQALVRVLAHHACDKHFVEIMTIVNNMIKSREGNSPASAHHRCKEMSIFHSTLCKKLYLFPIS